MTICYIYTCIWWSKQKGNFAQCMFCFSQQPIQSYYGLHNLTSAVVHSRLYKCGCIHFECGKINISHKFRVILDHLAGQREHNQPFVCADHDHMHILLHMLALIAHIHSFLMTVIVTSVTLMFPLVILFLCRSVPWTSKVYIWFSSCLSFTSISFRHQFSLWKVLKSNITG